MSINKVCLPTYANLTEVKKRHPEARQIRPKKNATFLCEGNTRLRSLNCMPVEVVAVEQNGTPRSHLAFVIFDERANLPGIVQTNFAHLLEGGKLIKELNLATA
jgi:hypothetical protein